MLTTCKYNDYSLDSNGNLLFLLYFNLCFCGNATSVFANIHLAILRCRHINNLNEP